jgi:hypothetical protein
MNCQLLVVTRQLPPQRARARLRAGFSFTEVLFAVMVLGIGFIMIAAMFPVTIRQTQTTMEETQAANMAKEAMAYLQSIATDYNFPVTVPPKMPVANPPVPDDTQPPQFVALNDVVYPAAIPSSGPTPPFQSGLLEARGNFINPKNPRFAWVPLYRRGFYYVNGVATPEPTVQVIMILVQSRNRTEYTSLPQPTATPNVTWNDLQTTPTFIKMLFATLQPGRVGVALQFKNGHGEISFPDLKNDATARTATGAYVVIGNDNINSQPTNGRIYQLGPPIDEASQVWSLTPGSEMVVHTPALPTDDKNMWPYNPGNPCVAYIIGRGYADMTQDIDTTKPDRGYLGPAQDIGIYTGFIQIRQP